MKKITQKELLEKYGISLPKGKYRIEKKNDNYIVSTIKDDTLGCILVGKNKIVGGLTESADTEIKLMEKLKRATEIWLTIQD